MVQIEGDAIIEEIELANVQLANELDKLKSLLNGKEEQIAQLEDLLGPDYENLTPDQIREKVDNHVQAVELKKAKHDKCIQDLKALIIELKEENNKLQEEIIDLLTNSGQH